MKKLNKEKKKVKSILFASNHFYPCIGGIERISFDLAKALSEKGFKVDIATLNKCSKNNEKLQKTGFLNNIKIHRFSFMNLKYYLPVFNVFKLMNS